MKKGRFLVFEGGEGSGKDTQIALLQEKFKGRDDVVFTREPGGTSIGEQIRTILLDNKNKTTSAKTELLLFLASRAQLLKEVIVPALEVGKIVVSNRFGLSTIAYQIYGREQHQYLDFLKETSRFVVGEHIPDLYILLDVTPEVGLERAHRREDENNRFDNEKLAFHERVRAGYTSHIGDFGEYTIINADQSIEDVQGDIVKALKTYHML